MDIRLWNAPNVLVQVGYFILSSTDEKAAGDFPQRLLLSCCDV